jgi:hypothetical protein
MTRAPESLRAALAQARDTFEPSAERLQTIRQRVLQDPARRVLDVEPPAHARVRFRGWLLGGTLAVLSNVAWWGTRTPVSPPPRSHLVAQALPTVIAEAPREDPEPRLPELAQRAEVALEPPAKVKRTAHHARHSRPMPAMPHHPPVEARSAQDELSSAHDAPEQRSTAKDDSEDLRDEVAAIARARRALERGDREAAEKALYDHMVSHPIGQLASERTAMFARVRCLAGDTASARKFHRELGSRAPGSALLRSVERACPELMR